MKRSIYSGLVVGVMGMGLAAADIKINDNLTINGFLDMSTQYHSNAFTFPGVTPTAVSDNRILGSFDQFEIDFMYKYGDHISARADVNSGNATTVSSATGFNTGIMSLEQAYVTYTEGALGVSVGRFLSVSGWEAAEPTGTFQYDYSDAFVYAGYENGLNVSYTVSPMISLYAAVVTDAFATDGNLKTPGEEAQIAVTPLKEVTIKATYVGQWVAAATDYQTSLINGWASYVMGPLTAAIEGDYLLNWTAKDDNGIGYLAMVNYKILPKLAATVRYSGMKTDAMAKKNTEVTFSPCYSIADNWWVLADVKYQIDLKEAALAAETTFTF